MLNMAFSRIADLQSGPLAANVPSFDRGVGLVQTNDGKLSTDGTLTNAHFVGVSHGQLVTPLKAVMVELITVPDGGGIVTLSRASAAGTTMLVRAAAGTTFTTVANITGTGTSTPADPSSGAVAAWTPAGSMTKVKFHADEAEKVLEVVYTYAPTVQEARTMVGEGVPGPSAVDETRMVSYGRKGIFFTDQFDTGNDWSVEDTIRVNASGKFVGGSTGATVNGWVVQVPTVDVPFLGISINA